MRLALFEPDIAGNVGTILRLCACLDVPLDIVGPCGFALGDKALKRAAMDYGGHVAATQHVDWQGFRDSPAGAGRLVLLSSKAEASVYDPVFRPGDTLMMGSEGAGVPPHVHDSADLRLKIPMRSGMRSLNVAVAAGIALAEALRQTGGLPVPDTRAGE
jgi:tRNA (cytidine/uridine-2'-O-)-methyltransferase